MNEGTDAHQPTPRKYTRFASATGTDEDIEALRELLANAHEAPYWVQRKPVPASLVPRMVLAFTRELSRSLNVNVYACAAWNNPENTLLLSQNLFVVNAPYEHEYRLEGVREHFADFVCRNTGTPARLPPKQAFPIPYPDDSMTGRPALPPKHQIWQQERENIDEWFTLVHAWQGGYKTMNWDLIVEDINDGSYAIIDKHRLPDLSDGIMPPREWDELTTLRWSAHLRSTMNARGGVDLACLDRAFQFRQLHDKDNNVIATKTTFQLLPHPESQLYYSTMVLMYASRLAETPLAGLGSSPSRADELYPPNYQPLVDEATNLVPQFQDLWSKIRVYQSQSPPEASPPSNPDFQCWPRAARHVIRDTTRFHENYTSCVYPDEFRRLDDERLISWDVHAFANWVASNPFKNESSQLQGGGPDGICVIVVSLLQYCVNVSRVLPASPEAATQLIAKGHAVYSSQDVYFLGRSVAALILFIDQATLLLPQLGTTYPSDNEQRRAAWIPDAWGMVYGDGAIIPLPIETLQRKNRPASNVFDEELGEWLEDTEEELEQSEKGSVDSEESEESRTSKSEQKPSPKIKNGQHNIIPSPKQECSAKTRDSMDIDEAIKSSKAESHQHVTVTPKPSEHEGNSAMRYDGSRDNELNPAASTDIIMASVQPIHEPTAPSETTFGLSTPLLPSTLASSTPRAQGKAAVLSRACTVQDSSGAPAPADNQGKASAVSIDSGTTTTSTVRAAEVANFPLDPALFQGNAVAPQNEEVVMSEIGARLMRTVQAWKGSSGGAETRKSPAAHSHASSTASGVGLKKRQSTPNTKPAARNVGGDKRRLKSSAWAAEHDSKKSK